MKMHDMQRVLSHFVRARWRWHTLSSVSLQRYQEERARRIVAYAQRHSPFYRSHWHGHDLHDWRQLPTINKELMMTHFDTFTTCGIGREEAMAVALKAERDRDFSPQLKGLTVGLSSGTSGHRGLFLVSPAEQAAWAGIVLARTLHRLPTKQLRVAFFLRSNSNLYEQVGRGPIQFRYFDLMLPLSEAVGALNAFQPHIVIGPPSLLSLLAGESERGSLSIHPQRLISVAEVLDEYEQKRLQNTFNAPVHQIYQCTEGFLAASCDRGSLHIQEDLVALQFEPITDSDGTRATPVITDLWRRTQPIIRYRLNDIVQLDPAPCVCGSSFRVIRAIEGRSDDICYFETMQGDRRPFFPDILRRMVLLASPHINDYQIVQERDGGLQVYLTTVPSIAFALVAGPVRASIDATIAHYDCRPVRVQIEEGLPAPIAGAKRRRVRRLAD